MKGFSTSLEILVKFEKINAIKTPATQDYTLMWDFYLRRISFKEFQQEASCKVDTAFLNSAILDAIENKDNDLLTSAIVLGCHIGFDEPAGKHLCQILCDHWHRKHEEIIRVLQFEVKVENCSEYVYNSLNEKFEYLYDMGVDESYIVQGVFLLKSIDSEESRRYIELLLNSDKEIVRKCSKAALEK